MSADTDLISEKVRNLSVSELLNLQQIIIEELRKKTGVAQNGEKSNSTGHVRLPHAYRLTREEVEASLAVIFSPEELARLGKTDFSKLANGPKSASEMLIEDREDRF